MQEEDFGQVEKSDERKILIKTVPPDDLQSLPYVDVREYLDTYTYTGPTKKGIRFSWDKLPEVISLLRIQARKLMDHEDEQLSLFTDDQQKRIFDHFCPVKL